MQILTTNFNEPQNSINQQVFIPTKKSSATRPNSKIDADNKALIKLN